MHTVLVGDTRTIQNPILVTVGAEHEFNQRICHEFWVITEADRRTVAVQAQAALGTEQTVQALAVL